MVNSEESLLRLIGQIYDAALEPVLWPDVLETIRLSTNGTSAFMFTVDVHPDQGGFLHLSNIDRSAFFPYFNEFHRDNPMFRAWEEKGAPSAQVFRGLELLSNPDDVSAFVRSDLYQKWAVPNQFTRLLGSIVYEKQPFISPKTNLNVFRPREAEAFETNEQDFMGKVMPHVQRSLHMYWRLTWMEKRQRAAQEVLDRIALGVLLLDNSGRLVMINRMADDLVRRNQGLAVRRGVVGASLDADAEALRSIIARTIATGAGKDTYPGGTIRLRGKDGGPGLLLLATPLSTQRVDANWLGPNICAALFLSEPDAVHPLSIEFLRDWFGLTPAESRVAVDLMNGLSAEEISERRQTSKETIRVQTKAVYEKTGVNRKTELAKLLLTSPAAMVHDGRAAPSHRAADK